MFVNQDGRIQPEVAPVTGGIPISVQEDLLGLPLEGCYKQSPPYLAETADGGAVDSRYELVLEPFGAFMIWDSLAGNVATLSGNCLVGLSAGNVRAAIRQLLQRTPGQPRRSTRSTARRWEYRWSMRSSLCPEMVAVSITFSPFSRRRETPSCRRS